MVIRMVEMVVVEVRVKLLIFWLWMIVVLRSCLRALIKYNGYFFHYFSIDFDDLSIVNVENFIDLVVNFDDLS